MNFASFPVPRGRLHHRALLRHCQQVTFQNPRHQYPLPENALAELIWWNININRSSRLHHPPISDYLVTDASELGWGAQLNNLSVRAMDRGRRKFSVQFERNVGCLVRSKRSGSAPSRLVTIGTERQSNGSIIFTKRGGTKSIKLMKMTRKIFTLLDQFNIHMQAQYIPGRYNLEVDRLSRLILPPEWHLLPQITSLIFAKVGSPRNRSFCFSISPRSPNIQHFGPERPASTVSRRFQSRMALSPGVGISATIPDTSGPATPQLGHGSVSGGSTSGSGLKESRLESSFFTIRNLNQVLIDTATSKPPPLTADMYLQVWRCGGGRNLY